MKLFERSGGHYLFWSGFVYVFVGVTLAITKWTNYQYATLLWMFVLILPLMIPPLGRYFNIEPVMFDFFKKDTPFNVVPFPIPAEKPSAPKPTPVPSNEEKELDHCHYTVGNDGNNNIVLKIHSEYSTSTLTMNEPAVRHMISLLEAAIVKE